MPNPFCLIPQYADAFIAKVKSGELDPNALVRMTSAERHAAFAEIMGDTNAAHVNASFESKLLLKNQQAGIQRWLEKAKDVSPTVKRDLLARVERMDAVLDPKSGDKFLADLARQRLGFSVSMEEAGKITALTKKLQEARAELMASRAEKGITPDDWKDYGHARVAFDNYMSDLKNAAEPSVAKSLKEATASGQTPLARLRAAGQAGVQAVKEIPGFAKSFKAAWDDSWIGRQGWKMATTHPTQWARNSLKSFQDIVRTFGGKAVMDEVHAQMYGRENMLNGYYQRAKLALPNTEEAYPTTLPEKLPLGIGRAYKASEVAFNAMALRNRLEAFDLYVDIAKKNGVDLNAPGQLEDIGKLVNSLTSRAHLGKLEPAADALNVLFFSARKLKSDFDFLTAHQFQQDVSPFVRKQAALNLVKSITATAAVLGTAKALRPESVDFDPRSANFGKIRVGHTRFDFTGGMASLVTLASRLLTMSSKSSTTGRVTPLNSGDFGATTGTDVVYNFLENKLSPASSIVKDLLKGKDFAGNKPTLGGEVSNLLMPLPITNTQEMLNDPKAAPVILGVLADAFGISANTYASPESADPRVAAEFTRLEIPWQVPRPTFTINGRTYTRDSAKQKAYAAEVAQQTTAYLAKTIASPAYQAMSDVGKAATLEKLQAEVHQYYSKQAGQAALRAGESPTRLSRKAVRSLRP